MTDSTEAARAWLALDPDPVTRAETEAMIASGADLTERFCGRLAFGTAGMRGPLAPGPNAMNRRSVRRITAAVATWLGSEPVSVVVGRDARRNSAVFAEDAARVLAARGHTVYLFDEVVPTPELAHAVLALGCAAGVMVTASHNPPGDNGYKLYAGDGAQIVSPADRAIEAALDALPLSEPVPCPPRAELDVRSVPAEVRERYLRAVLGLRVHPSPTPGLCVVYTPLHGVGLARLSELFAAAGYRDLHPVPEQAEPDGAFPTVAFPNPEEPGALDLALALAARTGADLVIANDPDADRLAVALPDEDGTWRQLTGNQVGCLLAEDVLRHHPERSERDLVATTIVSTSLLQRIAAHHGAAHVETLTGFKWIAHAAMEHEATGGRFALGFEEALGYSVGSVVRDKDGISAALLLCDLAAHLKREGRTLWSALEDLDRQHGVHVSGQHSVLMPGPGGAAAIAERVDRLRTDPPAAIAGIAVQAVRDVAAGTHVDVATGETTALSLPASNVLAFDLADGSRVLVRPSGTEPKLKVYFEAREPVDGAVAPAVERARARLDALRAAMVEAIA